MRSFAGSSMVSPTRAIGVVALAVLSAACSVGTNPEESPRSAQIHVEGTSPHPLLLVTSIDFSEQRDPATGAAVSVLRTSDTLHVTLPYAAALDLAGTGMVYVELRNPLVAAASIRMRVRLDNGRAYDQAATLSDNAALIYSYRFNAYPY